MTKNEANSEIRGPPSRLFPVDLNKMLVVGEIMTPKEMFVYYEDGVEGNDFDILPLKNLKEYWSRKDKECHPILPEDIISYHLDIFSFIDRLQNRDFYFVTYDGGINGIVHYSDLNKQLVMILFYILISKIELKIRAMYKDDENFVAKSIGANNVNKIKKGDKYLYDKKNRQELRLIDYLEFHHFISLLEADAAFLQSIKYSKTKFKKEFGSLDSLRNWVAHPTNKIINPKKKITDSLLEGKEKLTKLNELIDKYKTVL